MSLILNHSCRRNKGASLSLLLRRLIWVMLNALLLLLWGCRAAPTPEKLVFISAQGDTTGLYVVSTESGEPQRISSIFRWQRPQGSPDGDNLAFLAEYEELLTLYVLPDGSETPLPLTFGIEVVSFAWSPNGKEIAFSAYQGAEQDIYTISLETHQLVNLTAGNQRADTTPVWSPDGTHIAYHSAPGVSGSHLCQEMCQYRIYIIERDGANPQQITARQPPPTMGMMECAPAWSPDSRYLLFNSGCHPGESAMNIYRFNVQTEELIQLTTTGQDRGGSWLSDEEILFSTLRDGVANEQHYVMKYDGTHCRPFLPWDEANISAIASHDFRWFVWQDRSTEELLIGDLVTAEVTSTQVRGCDPVWAASGDKIAFTTACLNLEKSDVWLMNRDGTQLVNLTTDLAGNNYQPIWIP